MSDFENTTAFARYSEFSVGLDSVNPGEDGYPLLVDGFSGTAGKSRPGSSSVHSSSDIRPSINPSGSGFQGTLS